MTAQGSGLDSVLRKIVEATIALHGNAEEEPFPIGLVDINNWEWPQGIGLYGLFQYAKATEDTRIMAFLEGWFERHFHNGLPARNINTTAPLLALISWYEFTQSAEQNFGEKYLSLCHDWANWLVTTLPRAGEGAFQHTITGDSNDGQILIDTLVMATLFLAKLGKISNRSDLVDEALYQWLVHIKYLIDPKTGLFFHGWTFRERHHYGAVRWGRGNSWFTIGAVELFELLDSTSGSTLRLIQETWKRHIAALSALQERDGMWHTVLDDRSSYLESSSTAGFAYGILKGVRLGYLSEEWKPLGERAISGLVNRVQSDGVLRDVSYGTPVGETVEFYKAISVKPMTYGQALATLALSEGLYLEL
ncbi:glycoside hydrolase family 105 protein [Alicyclobacillus sp. SO9]|uniref:glycoside hydrolase family 88/105 protein n=1 Tax=Alicyclobacillus sp. SO9 TaxID=2665646 RepID=UPI0018E84980|nr:glycoside hydrolase family 88 protein [Alicyclobacillus sp. SO9]QQE80246.1 glycoside hydrolase family 88 protein [Alicyclobacillus sp. SO9]